MKSDKTYSENDVEILLAEMTLGEKLAQMVMTDNINYIAEMIDNGTFPENSVGSCYISDYVAPELINRVQKYILENTRLGIPLCVMGESLHGVKMRGATVFPQAIGLGSTFNEGLMSEIADVIGKEAYALGIRQTYAPNLDISRDPRWGRVEENYGEDPYLTSRLGVAYIKALQSHNVAASPKHYVAHGSPEGGLNVAPVHAGEREFREIMLESFKAAVVEGKTMSVMPAYSELDGVPIHASRYLLTDVLRGELGFDGYTVSDFGAVHMLHSAHKTAETPLDAGLTALNAGVDIEAPGAFGFGADFAKAAHDGRIPIDRIDEAVRRILRIKIRLGLFENPYADAANMRAVHTDESIALARKTARESAVLLKNNGILPLKNEIKKVTVMGPNADVAQLGDYTARGAEEYAVTLRAGLENRLGKENVKYIKGCNINVAANSEEEINEAVAGSDAVMIVLGDNSSFFAGVGWGDEEGGNVVTCGEGFDLHDLNLPAVQKTLLRQVKKSGKPVILILETGRPYCIGEECELADAVFQAWYPGEQGGNALCDLIFGDETPSGRLPISFPRSAGHIPCFYNCKPTARGYYNTPGSPDRLGRDYVFDTPAPLFAFGYGLSYTSFEYGGLKADREKVTVSVKNTGEYDAKETVLMFMRQHYCPVTPYVKRLRGFKKIMLKKGESRVVTFELRDDDFSFYNVDMDKEIGKGKFTVMIGGLECEIDIP